MGNDEITAESFRTTTQEARIKPVLGCFRGFVAGISSASGAIVT